MVMVIGHAYRPTHYFFWFDCENGVYQQTKFADRIFFLSKWSGEIKRSNSQWKNKCCTQTITGWIRGECIIHCVTCWDFYFSWFHCLCTACSAKNLGLYNWWEKTIILFICAMRLQRLPYIHIATVIKLYRKWVMCWDSYCAWSTCRFAHNFRRRFSSDATLNRWETNWYIRGGKHGIQFSL